MVFEICRKSDPKYLSAAVKQAGCALRLVNQQTLEICLEAVKNDPDSIKFVKPEFKEACKKEIEKMKSKHSLKYADTF